MFTLFKNKRIVHSANRAFAGTLADDEVLIEGEILGNHFIDDYGVVKEIPQRPDGASYFNYDTGEWVIDLLWVLEGVRSKRNKLLLESDWVESSSLSEVVKLNWRIYRQLLRDITLQPDPLNLKWPIKPS